MKHGSLFSGIGGFDLAAEWAGWENVFYCENNPFCKRILKYYWHKSIAYDDIKQTDFTIHRGRIDVLTVGFPCQPYSQAGKRLGKEDERHLWPEMLRAVREIAPAWVVGENVRGLTNWSGGLVFDEVQTDLETEGYEVQPFLLPAAGINAPHERYRIWFVAHAKCLRQQGSRKHGNAINNKTNKNTETGWNNYIFQGESVSHLFEHNDGVPSGLDGITFSKWRNESIKAAGNAIVPQVAYQIFKAINEYELLNNSK